MALTSALGGAAGLTGGGSAEFNYASLQTKYLDFAIPQAQILLGGQVFTSSGVEMPVSDINIELTSGFEAAIARFRIFNVYNPKNGQFRFTDIKSQVALGTALTIQLGYTGKLETVFMGFVAGVTFGYEQGELPFVEITGMDVKGVMMAGTYSYQLTADNYSDAVREIFQRTGYERLKTTGAMLDYEVGNTPDLDPQLLTAAQSSETARNTAAEAQRKAEEAQRAASLGGGAAAVAAASQATAAAKAAMAMVETTTQAFETAKKTMAATKNAAKSLPSGPTSAYSVELAAESDYEFVVKAAKKFNFEFFTDRGKVLFRKAKANASVLMELGSGSGILTFRVEYSITGIVGSIEARAMDPGQGKVITSKGTFSNAMSTGGQAKPLVSAGKKVFIDPTISSQAQADARVASLMEQMSYRLGTLEADCVGLPDLTPGRFIRLSGLGVPVDNTFYITSVTHEFRQETGYRTRIVGRTDKVEKGGPL